MAEKRVSVRLSATGGRQVRAELEGVGEAGSRGFGRLSREMELANTRMAAFSRRARIAATAAATALASAVVAMTRSNVAAANEINQLSQIANATPEVFQRWSAASATAGIEQEKLADILKDVNDRVGDFLQTGGGPMADFFENIAPRVGVTADQFARLSGPEALQLYVDSLERAGVSQQEMTFYLEAMASDATRLIPLLQNGGAEMTRLGAQAQALGAVLDADATAAMRRSELALVSIGQVFIGVRNRIAVALAPTLEAAANAFVALASSTSPISRAFDAVLGNLDRLAIYAGTFATFLAGRWVAAMAAAALSVRGLATTLVVLKGALIRTGIGALVVGAGELVYWFSRLVQGAGGFGGALGLLKDLATQVFTKLSALAAAWGSDLRAGWQGMKAEALWAFLGVIDGATGLANTLVNTMDGAVSAVAVVWQNLPRLLGSAVFAAANAVQQGIGSMLNWSIDRLNGFVARVNGITDRLPDWARADWMVLEPLANFSVQDIANPFAGAASDTAAQIKAEFADAFATDAFMPTNTGLIDTILGAEESAAAARSSAEVWRRVAEAPLTTWQALKNAVTSAGKAGDEALSDSAAAGARLTDALGNAGAAADKTREKLLGWDAVRDGLKSFIESATDWGNGLKGALTGAFSSAESAFRSFVNTGKFDFKSLVRSILADLAVLSFRRAVLAPIANVLFGGLSGGNLLAGVAHSGAVAGFTGSTRSVPSALFAAAPKMHTGGYAGLRPDEVPAILQRGERVLPRKETAAYGASHTGTQPVTIHIDARGAQAGVAEQIAEQLSQVLPSVRKIAREEVSMRLGRGYAL